MAIRMKKREKNKRQRTPFFGIPLIMSYLRPYVKTVLLMIFLGILSSLADTIFPLFNSWALAGHWIILWRSGPWKECRSFCFSTFC